MSHRQIALGVQRQLRADFPVDPTTLEPQCCTVVFWGFLRRNGNNNNNNNTMEMIIDKWSCKFSKVTMMGSNGVGKKNMTKMVW